MCFRKFFIPVFTLQICLLSQVVQAETYSTSEIEYRSKTKNSIELSTLNYQLFGIGISRDLWKSYSISIGIGYLPTILMIPYSENPTRFTNYVMTVPVTLRRYLFSDNHRPFLSSSVYNVFRSTKVSHESGGGNPKTFYDLGIAAGGGYEFRAVNGFQLRAGLELGYRTNSIKTDYSILPMLILPSLQLGKRF